MNGYGKKIGLWVGIALAVTLTVWGENIVNRFGWRYPEWLRFLLALPQCYRTPVDSIRNLLSVA